MFYIQMFGHLWVKKIKKKRKIKIFNGFTIDSNLVRKADKDAIILHCLPAYREKEITDEVIESKKSRIFEQAENRLHAQQALLSCLLSIKILAKLINKRGTNVLEYICFMETYSGDDLTQAQNELYGWIKDYMKNFQHSPSIRQMMQAMGLKSPAPIQSRLKHLQEKGYISWQEGKARTMQIVDEIIEGVPIMGSVAAGGLIETYSDVQENLDISDVLKKKNVFALTVNGDSMIDACIADGDMVLMEPITDSFQI